MIVKIIHSQGTRCTTQILTAKDLNVKLSNCVFSLHDSPQKDHNRPQNASGPHKNKSVVNKEVQELDKIIIGIW